MEFYTRRTNMLDRIHKFMKSGRLNKVIKLVIDRKKARRKNNASEI
jgi:hypothetical protein